LEQLIEYWSQSLEFPDPKVIFEAVWNKVKGRRGGEEKMNFPGEILWLGGAPGSGKGTNTPFVLRERGITSQPIVMSDLLNSPYMQKIKAQGKLVGDLEVLQLLLSELLEPTYQQGVIVDGFPRTKFQAECLKLLRSKMDALQHQFHDSYVSQEIDRLTDRLSP
jgi:adenylate kinase